MQAELKQDLIQQSVQDETTNAISWPSTNATPNEYPSYSVIQNPLADSIEVNEQNENKNDTPERKLIPNTGTDSPDLSVH